MRLILLYLSFLASFSAFASPVFAGSLEVASVFGNKALMLTYTDDKESAYALYSQPIGNISVIYANPEQYLALKQVETKKPDTKILQK